MKTLAASPVNAAAEVFKMMKIALIVLLFIGIASGTAAFDQNKALSTAGTVAPTGVMELSGVSSDIFDFAEFQAEPLGTTRLTFEERFWVGETQGVDEDSMTPSMRAFRDAEVSPL
jgi:hypothetical protein